MNKVVKYVILGVLTVLLLTVAVFYIINWVENSHLQGRLVFAKSYDAGAKINRVVITNAKNSVELHQENGYWKLAAFHDYYADFALVKSFFDTINNSTYLQPVSTDYAKVKEISLFNPAEDKNSSGTLIQTFIDNKLIDAFIIGMKDDDKGYFVARRADSNNIWLIGGDYDIPEDVNHWLPKSLLDIPVSAIEMLGIDGKLISRHLPSEDFHDRLGLAINTGWLLYNILSLNIVDVMSETTFNKTFNDAQLSKIYDIDTFYGLRFELDFFTVSENDVWINIKLSADSVALTSVNDYINDNNFLYDGWYFKIAPNQKEFLMNYKLM